MSDPTQNRTDAPYQFHAFEVSYFSAKVRPALRYKGLWVDERRADLGEIMRRTGLGFIPIVVTPEGETWQDSSDIYRKLEARHPEPPLFPATPLQRVAAHLVEIYANEFALIPAMHYRWGSELGEASARARFSAMIGSVEIGNKAADRMAKARFVVGAAPEAAAEIEAHTAELLAALSAHFEAHPYLLGARQSFADCALMGPIDGHFFCDLVSRRLLLETAIPVVGWLERCKFPNADAQGEWLASDALAPTLVETLSAMGRDAVPMILDLLRAFEAWADERGPDVVEPPRGIGACETSLRGVPVKRGIMAYTLFSVQQVLDYLGTLDAGERAAVETALASTGWTELLAYTPRHRLAKDGFKLVFEG
ncbi:MAG: glutathione S-transferase family protein [Deltaproteobacteria bacterium]|nr:glutathione S-transferase family protein [Deltaproteobacteria bacterium]MBW2448517.1 glutathione S-transferase family protein [Deltaproteobacteria bacterium]